MRRSLEPYLGNEITIVAVPGQVSSFEIEVSNEGPSDSRSVVLTDNIPTSILNQEFSLDGVTFEPWTGSLNIGILGAGVSADLSVVKFANKRKACILINTVEVTPTTPESSPNNNIAKAKVEIKQCCCNKCGCKKCCCNDCCCKKCCRNDFWC